MKNNTNDSRKKTSNSFFTGVIALVFLVIGYQTALFIQKAAVAHIVANRDHPDTVYIYLDEQGGRGPVVPESAAVPERSDRKPSYSGKSRETGERYAGPDGNGARQQVAVRRVNAPHGKQATAIRQQHASRQYQSFHFNPNTASVEELQLLGFSLKQAQSIDNYRKKGGRFRRRADFAKSFVVADSVYRRLEPYIDIPKTDINTADSAAFDALPGIGGYFASQMVRYRQRLGGYSCKEQLLDIRHFDEEKLSGLEELITVSPVDPYPLWSLPEDSLYRHPYIGSAARSIVFYRQNNPRDKWTLEGLRQATVLSDESYRNLSRCRIALPK